MPTGNYSLNKVEGKGVITKTESLAYRAGRQSISKRTSAVKDGGIRHLRLKFYEENSVAWNKGYAG